MSITISDSKNFVSHICIACGTEFFFLEAFDRSLKECKNSFYCPNGHPQCYTKSKSEEVREMFEKSIERKDEYIQTLYAERNAASARARKAESALKKLQPKGTTK